MARSPGPFDHSLPHGFHYRENFITEAEERVLLDAIGHVAFSDFEMRGSEKPSTMSTPSAAISSGCCKALRRTSTRLASSI